MKYIIRAFLYLMFAAFTVVLYKVQLGSIPFLLLAVYLFSIVIKELVVMRKEKRAAQRG